MNVRLALRNEGAKDYADLIKRRDALKAELREIRDAMHKIEDHADIEDVDLMHPHPIESDR